MPKDAERRAANRAAWAAGVHLPRWSSGEKHAATPGPRTGPPAHEEGAAARKAAKDAQRATNRAAWIERIETARKMREAARGAARLERRRADRVRAAAWHQGRRDDLLVHGGDLAVMLAADIAARSD